MENIKEKIDNFFAEYRYQIAPIMAKYKELLLVPETLEDSPEYNAFLEEIKPHWQELARKCRKARREVMKS